ncbi:outer membrane protein assembly factor BamA [Sphingosinicella sp. YJ22]|uniref:outer membrane protein assembly factor BamA n=1 Tax=Sphingosinicella sp. YJ22 TaxID=1104780 RepID=UPI001FAEB0EA|nr:outer membrane protein assembly factor BamA [Sphingosinicella sp. YJ22]
MTSHQAFPKGRHFCTLLLVGTALGGFSAAAHAQDGQAQTQQPAAQQVPTIPLTPPAVAPAQQVVRSINVTGNQRLEAETVISYITLRPGEAYDRSRIDQALRELYATELFADVQIAGVETGNIVIQVRENPVINRIILEGNRRLKDDKITPEIRLAARQIFTRSRARADVARIIELYRRQGRFAARVEPKIVQLDQNRVDVVFEIEEGPRSQVRQINIIGNEAYGDSRLVAEMATREARGFPFSILGGGNETYDPDRMAFDQQKLRQFYLTQGYADFRVVSAVAELTPDRRDFIITYVVEEGPRYKFGEVTVNSEIRDFSSESLQEALPMRTGDFYNARQVEDTVTRLNELAGLYGYAFTDVNPRFSRNPETLTMDVNFQVNEAQRTYVDRINISGNTNTADKVIRREFRLAEGDPFNSIRVRRSRDRINSLGYFQENLEIEQQELGPDRMALNVEVEERATGELQLSAGFSSIEQILVNLSVQQRNFRGLGQQLRAAINYSSYSRSFELGFTEPYLFDRNVAVGFDLYRRDLNSFSFVGNERRSTFDEVTTGGQVRVGIPLTERMQLALRYSLNLSEISLAPQLYFTDPDGTGPLPASCDPLLAGRYLCDLLGERVVSSLGYTLVYSTLNNSLRPTSGFRALLQQDFAGLGGDVRYLRTRASAARYWSVGRGFVLSASAEGGAIFSFEDGAPGVDPILLTDRFTLGSPQMRGFDIRGIGPRVLRRPYAFDEDGDPVVDADGNFVLDDNEQLTRDEAIGGRYYYLAHLELEIPVSNAIRELGVRPSVFVDVGALWGVRQPNLLDITPGSELTLNSCQAADGTIIRLQPGTTSCPPGSNPFRLGVEPFREVFVGDTPSPRVSVGFGVNWNSPFGPFRIDVAYPLLSQEGDDTRIFTFNVGTAF